MTGSRTRALLLVALGFALGAFTVGGAFAARYMTGGETEVTSIKLTGGGLPDLGAESTYGVAELPETIRAYHDSGAYGSDLGRVASHARRSLGNQLRRLRESPGPGRYSECNRAGRTLSGGRAASCSTSTRPRSPTTTGSKRPASARRACPRRGQGQRPRDPADARALPFARKHGVEAFFITGRPEGLAEVADTNLRQVGYDQGYTLITKPPGGLHTIEYKSGERARIEEELGFTVLVNVGDQDSDLAEATRGARSSSRTRCTSSPSPGR